MTQVLDWIETGARMRALPTVGGSLIPGAGRSSSFAGATWPVP
jgi:hypothetical protein